jgi:hypothetical protein
VVVNHLAIHTTTEQDFPAIVKLLLLRLVLLNALANTDPAAG